MGPRQEIEQIAQDLDAGDSTRVVCPSCEGGSSRERSCSVTRLQDSRIAFQCFRAKCDFKGFLTSKGYGLSSWTTTRSYVPETQHQRFEGVIQPLPDEVKNWITLKWGIQDMPAHWHFTPEFGERILMSVRAPRNTARGWVLRGNSKHKTKALTYLDSADEVKLSWYNNHSNEPTILVEDIPSAIRASKYVNSVALLGTHVGPEAATEIARYATRPIVIALDNDATGQSFLLTKRYGLLWDDVRVLPLAKDLKDQTEEELIKTLEVVRERETCSGSGYTES